MSLGEGLIIMFIVLGSVFGGSYVYEKFLGCPGRASGQGLTGDYGVVQGCVFTLPDGKKVNETNYRVI